jgi:hypothetical protein
MTVASGGTVYVTNSLAPQILPTAVAKVGGTAWVTEGQLLHLFGAKNNGPPRLPFEIVPVAVGD